MALIHQDIIILLYNIVISCVTQTYVLYTPLNLGFIILKKKQQTNTKHILYIICIDVLGICSKLNLTFVKHLIQFVQIKNKNIYSLLNALYRLIGQVGRVFANGLGDLGSIPGCVIPKTLKMVRDTSLLNTQQYEVSIKGKVEQSRERSSALPYTSV